MIVICSPAYTYLQYKHLKRFWKHLQSFSEDARLCDSNLATQEMQKRVNPEAAGCNVTNWFNNALVCLELFNPGRTSCVPVVFNIKKKAIHGSF